MSHPIAIFYFFKLKLIRYHRLISFKYSLFFVPLYQITIFIPVKKIIFVLFLSTVLFACNSTKYMTNKEKTITNSHGADTPFRVLQTDNYDDSLFLRQKSTDIDVKNIAENKDWQHFIERLKLTLAVESGVGIAAPQVGVARNLFLFIRIDRANKAVQVAINPRIVNYSDETFCFEGDGCLSIPDLAGSTKRHKWIDVEYYNEKGDFIKERLYGASREGDFTGVIFQHEFDHLSGILFTDRLFDCAASLHRSK